MSDLERLERLRWAVAEVVMSAPSLPTLGDRAPSPEFWEAFYRLVDVWRDAPCPAPGGALRERLERGRADTGLERTFTTSPGGGQPARLVADERRGPPANGVQAADAPSPGEETCDKAEGHAGWIICPVHGAELHARLVQIGRDISDATRRDR